MESSHVAQPRVDSFSPLLNPPATLFKDPSKKIPHLPFLVTYDSDLYPLLSGKFFFEPDSCILCAVFSLLFPPLEQTLTIPE